MIITIIVFPVWICVTISLSFFLGWMLTRRQHDEPFNWRIFAGPWMYQNWLCKRRETS